MEECVCPKGFVFYSKFYTARGYKVFIRELIDVILHVLS